MKLNEGGAISSGRSSYLDICEMNAITTSSLYCPIIKPIRGGTDGSRLSFMGIPCPNLFAGGHNFHGPYEFIPVSSMEKAVNVIIGIAEKFSVIDSSNI